MNPSKRRLCSVIHVVVCLGLMGGAVWSADFASPLKAQLPQEETTGTITSPVTPILSEEAGVPPTAEMATSSAEEEASPVEADTPVPSEESITPTPYEAPPDPLSPVETPPAPGVPDTAVVETPSEPEESAPAPVNATPTNEYPPTAIPEASLIQETSTAEVTDTAPPAEVTLSPPGEIPVTQEIPDAPILIEAPATPENDLPSTPSSSLTSTVTITPPPDSSLMAQTMPGAVVINEIGWAGTVADITAQWIELYNTTSEPIWLSNWRLSTADGRWVINLAGIIAAQGYFLLECNNDLTVRDVPADNIYVGALSPEGETLHLLDASGALIDTANGDGGPWPAGDRTAHRSMERLSPYVPDLDENWVTHNGLVHNGEDVLGNPINGTPRQRNASTYPPPSAMPGEVLINEVAWSGTQADSRAEWIELSNTTERAIDVGGWQLKTADGGLTVMLHGVIAPHGFFLLEREDDLAVADIPADQVADFGDGLDDGGEVLQLLIGTLVIDTANGDGGPWPGGSGVPAAHSMERIAPHLPDEDTSWASHDGFHHVARDMAGNPINGTPRTTNSTMLSPALLISEFLYAGITPDTQGDEFVELCNAQPVEATLYHIKIGDAAQTGKGESMWEIPSGAKLSPNACLVIAKNAAQFAARFGFLPDFELVTGSAPYPDTPTVPDLIPYTTWAGRAWALDDSGDEIVLLGPDDQIVDSVAYLGGDYAVVGLSPDPVRAPSPYSLQRLWPLDSNIMPADFTRALPSPGRVTAMPQPPAVAPPTVNLHGGMHAYWGVLNHPSSYSDGNTPPVLAFATARAAGLHFLAITDDAAALNPRLWSDCRQRGALASQTGAFVALCGFEYRALPQSFASVWNTADYLAPPNAPGDAAPMLDTWLTARPEALVSLRQVRSITPLPDVPYPSTLASRFHLWQVYGSTPQAGGVDPLETAWVQMLALGWQLAPLPDGASASGDAADFGSRRVGVVAPQLTPDELLAALRARRIFATQDNRLALTLRSDNRWMGSTLSTPEELLFAIEVADVGTVAQPITLTLFDRSTPLAMRSFPSSNASWSLPVTTQPGHYYWVRAVQADGDVASSAPIWIAGTATPETVIMNEVLPAPRQVDWNGDGMADRWDEWIELYNPDKTPIGLGGWQVGDASGKRYVLPLLTTIPARGYLVLHALQTQLVLNNTSDEITLRRADGSLAERYLYERGPGYDLSSCRLPDGIGSWQRRCQPTPGSANRALPEEGPTLTDIRGARQLPVGSWVKVRGHITVPPGVFSPRIAYLQDDHSGMRLYLPKDHRLVCAPGDRVEVIGRTGNYYGELQLRVQERDDVHRIREGAPPSPLPIMSGQMVEPYEGMFVLLAGRVSEIESGGSFWLDDGSGPARVYLDPDTGIKPLNLSVGQSVQVAGVVSQYRHTAQVRNDGYRLLPRFPGDVTCTVVQEQPDILVPLRLPETGAR